MIILDWPTDLPPFEVADLSLISTTASPGRGLDGREQILWRENRYWEAVLTLASLRGARVMRLRAIADELRGRLRAVRVPLCNRYTPRLTGTLPDFQARIGFPAYDISAGQQRWSDGTLFTDGTGWALPDGDDPVTRNPAPAGASRILLHGYIGRHLSVGAMFSIDGFLYRIAANDDGDLRFNPPLRTAIPAGAPVKVNRPEIVCRLADDGGLRVPDHHSRIMPQVTITFVEVFDR